MGLTPRQFVVQCIREIGPGGGVSGVAHAIEVSLLKRGINVSRFTIANCGLTRSRSKPAALLAKKTLLLFDVVYFSIVGTILAKWRISRGTIICHNDTLYGTVYVNHGIHRAMLDASGRKWRMMIRNPIHAFLVVRERLRFSLDLHDHYVCFSSSERNLMIKYYPKVEKKIRIIPNGVDVERFAMDAEDRALTRSELQFADDHFTMIFLGHEFERKGLYSAISALKFLSSNTRLLVGGGTDDEIRHAKAFAKREAVADRIIFLGVVVRTEKYLRASDCLVLPSSFEAWPLVGLEAMACGIPALMTAVGGIPDFLTDGLNGYVITQDPADIAAKVSALRLDPPALAKMKIRCVEFAARYSWDQIADKYLTLLQ